MRSFQAVQVYYDVEVESSCWTAMLGQLRDDLGASSPCRHFQQGEEALLLECILAFCFLMAEILLKFL